MAATVERLGELPQPIRDEFEEHFLIAKSAHST